MLVDSKIKNYQIYRKIVLLFIFLHQPSISDFCSSRHFSYWYYDDGDVWSDTELFNRIRLVIIGLTINLTFIGLSNSQRYFTLLINCTLETLVLISKLAIVLTDLTFMSLICPPGNSSMNCMLNFIIHQGPNTIMTVRSFSHKSRFICHFRIATLSRRIVF